MEEFNDLGVLFDAKGTFKAHVSVKAAKGMAMLGFIRRSCVKFRDSFTLRTVFGAHVRSHVEYASTVWLPYHDSYTACIERVQRRFTRYAMMKSRACAFDDLPSYRDRCDGLSLQQLDVRRMMNCAVVAYDVLSGRMDSDFLRSQFVLKQNRENARHTDAFVVPYRRTDYGKYEPVTMMVRMLNCVVRRFSLNVTVPSAGVFDIGVDRQCFRKLTLECIQADDFRF